MAVARANDGGGLIRAHRRGYDRAVVATEEQEGFARLGITRSRRCLLLRAAVCLAACLAALGAVTVRPPAARAQSNGEIIAFTVGLDFFGGALGSLIGSEERGGIFVMRPDGTGLRQLTSFRSFNFMYHGDVFHLPDDHPTVSPDGRRILFSSSRLDDDGVLGGIADQDPGRTEE